MTFVILTFPSLTITALYVFSTPWFRIVNPNVLYHLERLKTFKILISVPHVGYGLHLKLSHSYEVINQTDPFKIIIGI